MNKYLAAMEELNPDAIQLDGLDDAIIGIAHVPCNSHIFVYSREKCIEVTMRDQKWDREEATEWLEFNTFCAYLGEHNPVFMEEIEDCEIVDKKVSEPT